MAASDSSVFVVLDAGPLIHLDELDCIGLLDDFGELVVPTAVWSEVSQHRPSAFSAGIVFQMVPATHTFSPEQNALVQTLNLHEGEREALCIALAHPGALLLTDDAAARLAARNLGIAAHGTIGVLFRAIRRGRKTGREVADLLRSTPVLSTLHIRRSLLDEFIQQAEQS
jgi:predicted nucleic acid-binding protein